MNEPTSPTTDSDDWIINIRFGDSDVPHVELFDEVEAWLSQRFPGFSGVVAVRKDVGTDGVAAPALTLRGMLAEIDRLRGLLRATGDERDTYRQAMQEAYENPERGRVILAKALQL